MCMVGMALDEFSPPPSTACWLQADSISATAAIIATCTRLVILELNQDGVVSGLMFISWRNIFQIFDWQA